MYKKLSISRFRRWDSRAIMPITGLLLLLVSASAVAANPEFKSKKYTADLLDTAGIDSAVVTVVATDADGEEIKYSITGGNTGEIFSVDQRSGAITLQKKLDYKSVRKYSLTVQAKAGEDKATVMVVVNVKDASIQALIGSTKPMTAVLFSALDRNRFEVVKDPNSTDPTVGIINQNQKGTTAGILIAAEAPFAMPDLERGSVIPIGAWFGVNLKSGGGDDINDVDLAAGISISLISAKRMSKLQAGGEAGLSGSARLLLGVVYGEVATLGPKNPAETLEVGDPYPLGESLPLRKDMEIAFVIGIGFRF